MADDDRPPRAAFLAAAVAITAAMAYLAFLLGAWGFETRRYGQHEGRLRKLLLATPRLDQVVQAFEAENSPLVASARGPRELDEAAARWGGDRRNAVVAKGARWPQARVFAAGDMVYFIFFDEAGVMRDYAFVSR